MTGLAIVALVLIPTMVLVIVAMHWGAGAEPPETAAPATKARTTLAAIIVFVGAASVAFRLIGGYGLHQSAALFIGIPVLLAVAAVFSPAPRSAIGVACKAVTIGLLCSLVFLGEGVLCVLMSAPLFYAVAIGVGATIDYARRSNSRPGRTLFSCVALLALVPMSLEGVTEDLSFNRLTAVTETRIVHASADDVARALIAAPRFDRALPPYLRAGFPRPTAVRIDADRWVISLRGGEMRLDGMEPRAGDLILALDEKGPAAMQWRAIADGSHMTHFLNWRSSRVEWEAIDATTTRVTWTIRYRRGLDPAWYFGPMERYAVGLAAGYLIDAVATPVDPGDPYLIVRAASLYIAVVLTVAAWLYRRPGSGEMAGAMLAFAWNLPLLLMLHVAADWVGWWRFDAEGGLLLGMPVDMYIAWACLWGAIPALAMPRWPLGVVMAVALAFDLVLMPAAFPVVQLGPAWLVGEFAGLALGLLPAQLLARWTARNQHLVGRACLQVVAFTGLVLFVVPAIAIEGSGGEWTNPGTRPGWQLSLILQLLAGPAVLGLTAVQEFVTRGGGTPIPFDPPRRIVTTGVYAYVANPMQVSAVALLLMLGVIVGNLWVCAAGVMAHIYSVGLAGWDEGEDLRRRFDTDWVAYRHHVPRWLPRWRPWYRVEEPVATLYVSAECGKCRQVGMWFHTRRVRGLEIVPAESHPSRALSRITYESVDGTYAAAGIQAIARALEHVHLGWAMVGFLLRLPLIGQLAQLLADASGGQPRRIASRPTL